MQMDTTKEPDTTSAGTKLTLLLKSIVSIFLFSISVTPNQTIKKTSHWLITIERSNYLISTLNNNNQPYRSQ